MLKWLKKWRKERRNKQFLISEARRYMQELDMDTEAKMSAKAVLAMAVGVGVAYLQVLAMAKQFQGGEVPSLHKVQVEEGVYIYSGPKLDG